MQALEKKEMTTLAAKVAASVPKMKESVDKAKLAMSAVQKITSDKELEKANEVMKKVRATFKIHDTTRKEITKQLDDAKKSLMDITRPISPTDKNSEYIRLKTLADTYVTNKAREAEEERKRIQQQAEIKREELQIKVDLENAISLFVQQQLDAGQNAMIDFKSSLTVENYDEKTKRLNYKPQLKEDKMRQYLNAFFVGSSYQHIDIDSYIEQAISQGFEKANSTYSEEATKHLEDFKQSLQGYKKKLEEGHKANIASEKAKLKAEHDRKAKEAAEKAESAKADALIETEFASQVAQQSIEDVETSVRRSFVASLATGTKGEQIQALQRVIMHVASRSDFEMTKENGEYVDGVAYWLKQLVKVTPVPQIEGIEVEEKLSNLVR